VNGAKWLLLVAWLMAVFSLYRFGPILHQPLIPRILLVMVSAGAVGLRLYYLSAWISGAPFSVAKSSSETTIPSSYLHQRRDLFAQKISELSDRCNELRQIPARLAVVAVKSTGLPLQGEQAEQNTALIASVKEKQKSIEKQIGIWTESIEKLHFIYRNLTSETDALAIERLIAIVQIASDDIKQTLSDYSSMLYVLETTNEFIKTNLAERDEKIRQINQDFERQVEKINQEFERKMAKLENKFRDDAVKLPPRPPTPDMGASPP
jgi:chromosome segregation ATPase